jgi:hypothetical protein
VSKLDGETPSRKRAWSLIVLLEINCRVTEEMPVITVNRVVDRKIIIRKIGRSRRRSGTRGC